MAIQCRRQQKKKLLISNSRRVSFGWFLGCLNLMCRSFETHCSIFIDCSHDLWIWKRQSVQKLRHIKFRCRGIIQTKEYNNKMFKFKTTSFILSNKQSKK
jgi:hypothetical protein